LSANTLRADHPELVAVNLSCFGTGDPMQGRKAYDMLIHPEAGLIQITGTLEHVVKTGSPPADTASGMFAAQAALLSVENTIATQPPTGTTS
jgi:itaconate CoA-transferase